MSRADRVADALAERELDALLVTDLVNLRYLTGFTGSNGMAVVGPRPAPLHHRLPLRRAGGARRSRASTREQAPQDFIAALSDGWPEGALRLGFEDDQVSVRRHAPAARAAARPGRARARGRGRRGAAGGQGRRARSRASAPPPSSPTRST